MGEREPNSNSEKRKAKHHVGDSQWRRFLQLIIFPRVSFFVSAPSVAHEEARLVPLQDVVVEELGGDSIDYLHLVLSNFWAIFSTVI